MTPLDGELQSAHVCKSTVGEVNQSVTLSSVSRGLRRAYRNITTSALLQPRTQEERNARLLCVSTALIGVPSGGIVAFLPVFLARLGADSTLLGWLSSAPALIAMLSLLPGAMIAERHSDQVRVRVVCARLVRAAYLLCGIAPFILSTRLLPLALVGLWAIKTLPEAAGIPAWTAVMSQAISPQRRAQLNGTRWALLSLVSALSSAGFGLLLDRITFPLNYQVVFLISFVLGGLDPMAFARIKVPPLERTEASLSRNLLQRLVAYFGPIIHHKPFLVLMVATVLYRIALNLPAPLFSLFWVNDLRAPDTLIGLRGTVGFSALVVGYTYWGRSANRMGHRKVLIISALGLAFYPVLTALSPTSVWLLPAAVIWGLTASGIDVGLFDLMLAIMPTKRQPLFAAVYSIMGNAAAFVGPLLGALLAMNTSVANALLIAGVAQLATTIPFLLLPRDV